MKWLEPSVHEDSEQGRKNFWHSYEKNSNKKVWWHYLLLPAALTEVGETVLQYGC